MQGQRYPNPSVAPSRPQYQPHQPHQPQPPLNQQQLNSRMSNLSMQPQQHPQNPQNLHQPQPPQQNGFAPPAVNGQMAPQPPRPNSNYQQYQPAQYMSQQHQPLVPPPSSGPAPPAPPPADQQFQQPQPQQQTRPLRPIGMRPAPNTVPTRPYPNGQSAVPPPSQHSQYPTQQQQQPQQQSPQMSPLVVPRPLHKLCGQPRPYFYRSLSGNNNNNNERSNMPGITSQIPPANSDYISLDDGNARLRFARLTTNAISVDPQVMNKSQVPFAMLLQPFANIQSKEHEIPIVKNANGPLRCERCNAYCNPGFKFINGGQEYQCNLCHNINKTPQEHFSPIDHNGLRMDYNEKLELKLGSVDYIVDSPDYYITKPKPSKYIFAIDISLNSINSGLSISALQSIKSSIQANIIPGCNYSMGGQSKIAIITFDKTIHFYDGRNSSDDSSQVKMNIVPDIMEPFVPIGGDALFLTPTEAINAIDTIIEIHNLTPDQQQQLSPQQQSQQQTTAECSLGSVLEIIKQSLTNIGGKVYIVSGSIPTSGINKLERRGGGLINGNEDREISLLKESNSNYDILGCELAENNVSIDLILAPTSIYVDCSTLSRICRNSGGKMFLFTGFDIIRDGASLHRTICISVSEPRAFEALLRIRTSPGVEQKGEYIGNFGRPQRGDDVSGPVFDSSTTLGLEFSVVSKLDNNDENNNMANGNGGMTMSNNSNSNLFNEICIQSAILYTDCNGTRRIRVHTVFVRKTTVMADMFSCADVDTTAAFFAKRVASAILYGGTPFSKGWDGIMQKMSQMFYMYRKHCTSSQANGQLILPEAYKTLPLLMLGLIKSTGLRKNGMSDGVTIDERANSLSFIISATIQEISSYCYPRIFDLSNLKDSAGLPLPLSNNPQVLSNSEIESNNERKEQKEPISLPDVIPCNSSSLDDNKILLIENGMQLFLWVGNITNTNDNDNNSTDVQKLINQTIVNNNERILIRSETANSVEYLKNINDDRSKKIINIIQRICNERKWLSRPVVVERMKPGSGGEAKWILPLLIEDKSLNGMHSYMEYLRAVHKEVMDKMANDNAQSDLATWEMLNHGY